MSKKLSKLLAFALSVCMLVGLAPAVSPPAHAADTAIGSATDLLLFANTVNSTTSSGGKYYGNAYLTADIDMSLINSMFQPIAKTVYGGKTTSGFAGTFDGRGHVIYNLNISKAFDASDHNGTNSIYKSGLFGTINGGTVKNLIVQGTVRDSSNATLVSLFAGNAVGATFLNCGAVGTTSGYSAAAFIGTTEHSSGQINYIYNCWASVSCSATSGMTGFIGNKSGSNYSI